MKHFIKIKEGLKYFRNLILSRYPIIKYNNTSWILNDDWERNIARRAKIAKRRGCCYQKETGFMGKYLWNHRWARSGMDAIYLHHLSASILLLFATDTSISYYSVATSYHLITSGRHCKNTDTGIFWWETFCPQEQCEMDAFWMSGKSLEYIKGRKVLLQSKDD